LVADPQAELYYNDYNLWKPAKRDAAMIERTKMRKQLGSETIREVVLK
jgi:endo-1,4-beta-xylanase